MCALDAVNVGKRVIYVSQTPFSALHRISISLQSCAAEEQKLTGAQCIPGDPAGTASEQGGSVTWIIK